MRRIDLDLGNRFLGAIGTRLFRHLDLSRRGRRCGAALTGRLDRRFRHFLGACNRFYPQSLCQRVVVFHVSFCDVLLLLLAELLVRRCRFVNLTAVGVCLRLCRICQLRQRRELGFGIVDLLIEFNLCFRIRQLLNICCRNAILVSQRVIGCSCSFHFAFFTSVIAVGNGFNLCDHLLYCACVRSADYLNCILGSLANRIHRRPAILANTYIKDVSGFHRNCISHLVSCAVFVIAV